MAFVIVEKSDLEVSKQDVKACDDIELLTQWLDEQNETAQEIAIMIGSMKLCPDVSTEGMARKLGFVNRSKAWIQRRLSELGVRDDRVGKYYGREKKDNIEGRKAHLEVMEKSLQERNAKIKALNIENTALKEKVKRLEHEKFNLIEAKRKGAGE